MPRSTPLTFAFPSPAEALAALLAHIQPVETEHVALPAAAGRILAQTITSDRPSPAVDVSSMDGYAIRLADLTTSALPIAGEVRIGHEPPALPAAACLRIVTGAPIPPGADAVIKREDIAEHPDRIDLPRALRVQSGQNIRRAGENLRSGDTVITGGRSVSPAIAAALATFGVSSPIVHRPIRVHIITTGDEVVPPTSTPTPWQLRNSNAAALQSLLAAHPCIQTSHAHINDDPDLMNAAVADALAHTDALLCTGGVSMGHRDFVSDAITAAGILPLGNAGEPKEVGGAHAAPRGRVVFHGLPQRPGKPVLGALTSDGRPVLALPGNPVSVMVTARRLALPAILARAGCIVTTNAAHRVELTNPDAVSSPLYHHRLVRLVAPGTAELIDTRSSGDIVGAARADGFIEVPPNTTGPGPWPFFPWPS